MNASAWSRLTAPILRRIRLLVTRGVVNLVDSAQLMQLLQVELLSGETLDGVEHYEPYGLTAHPFKNAEVVAVSLNGRRDKTIVIIAADRRYRLTGLSEGEVALYDDQDQKVHLKRDGIHIKTPLPATIDAGGDVLVKSAGKATVEANGTVEIKGAAGAAVKGLVQGDCLCAFTGQPHAMVSATAKGSV